MPYRIRITDTARQEMRRLPGHVRQRVRRLVEALADEPTPSGARGLAGLGRWPGCQSLPFQAQPARVPRIGSIWPGTADSPLVEAFRQGLQELGYVEGRNISVEWRFAEGQADRFVPLAAELAGL